MELRAAHAVSGAYQMSRFGLNHQIDRYWLGRLAVSAAIGWLFASGCLRPAYLIYQGDAAIGKVGSTLTGWQTFTEGWLFGPYFFPWTANLWLLVGWGFFLAGRFHVATVLAGIAVLCALLMCLFDFSRLLSGYWFWLGSILALFAGASLLWAVDRLMNCPLHRGAQEPPVVPHELGED